MIEKMIVKKVEGDKVVVSKKRESSCGNCPAKNLCTSNEEEVLLVLKRGDMELLAGDEVLVDIPGMSPAKVAVVAYIVPLSIFLSLLLIGNRLLFLNEPQSLLFGLSGVFLYYAIFGSVHRKREREPFIVKKLQRQEGWF